MPLQLVRMVVAPAPVFAWFFGYNIALWLPTPFFARLIGIKHKSEGRDPQDSEWEGWNSVLLLLLLSSSFVVVERGSASRIDWKKCGVKDVENGKDMMWKGHGNVCGCGCGREKCVLGMKRMRLVRENCHTPEWGGLWMLIINDHSTDTDKGPHVSRPELLRDFRMWCPERCRLEAQDRAADGIVVEGEDRLVSQLR